MKFDAADQELRNPKVFYPDPKNIDLDRVLINLFILLRCNGTRPAGGGRQKADAERVAYHLEILSQMSGVSGFDEHKEVARGWLESDIFDLVNRGTEREAVSSLRPLHLDAHKVRVTKHCRDYNVSDALYSMLEAGERATLDDLKTYLNRGQDAHAGRYDGKSPLDLETLTVLKLVEQLDDLHPSNTKVAPHPPTCVGQARLLCDDVQRLLAYQDVTPRPVLIDYLKTILGLHVGLYILRQARQLSGWVAEPHRRRERGRRKRERVRTLPDNPWRNRGRACGPADGSCELTPRRLDPRSGARPRDGRVGGARTKVSSRIVGGTGWCYASG